jgi:hypothetical protein
LLKQQKFFLIVQEARIFILKKPALFLAHRWPPSCYVLISGHTYTESKSEEGKREGKREGERRRERKEGRKEGSSGVSSSSYKDPVLLD